MWDIRMKIHGFRQVYKSHRASLANALGKRGSCQVFIYRCTWVQFFSVYFGDTFKDSKESQIWGTFLRLTRHFPLYMNWTPVKTCQNSIQLVIPISVFIVTKNTHVL